MHTQKSLMLVNNWLAFASISQKYQLITKPRIVTEIPVTTVNKRIRPKQQAAFHKPLAVRCRFVGKTPKNGANGQPPSFLGCDSVVQSF